MAAELEHTAPAGDWKAEVRHLSSPVLGFSWETRIVRPDGTWVVGSRSADDVAAINDADAAAFAIAVALDPEHNGPWQPPEQEAPA